MIASVQEGNKLAALTASKMFRKEPGPDPKTGADGP
jgi:hypothetical protein